jgi:hypothetical protein
MRQKLTVSCDRSNSISFRLSAAIKFEVPTYLRCGWNLASIRWISQCCCSTNVCKGCACFACYRRVPKRSRRTSNPKRLGRFFRPISTPDRRDALIPSIDCGPGAVANKASPIFVNLCGKCPNRTVNRSAAGYALNPRQSGLRDSATTLQRT